MLLNNPQLVKPRVQSIDLLRGIVMIIMALDHVRHIAHIDFIKGENPLDFSSTSPFLFFTRWITHFCAPVFIFLGGTSIFFMSARKTKKEISLFLLTRGLWLIFLELTIIYFGWESNFYYYRLPLQVIYVIGLCMVIFSALIFIPRHLQIILGILLIFGHNLLDRFDDIDNSIGDFIWGIVHVRHIFILDSLHRVTTSYPLIPWIGVMLIGFRFGELYKPSFLVKRRKKILIRMGVVCILLFLLLRWRNFYGDTHYWKPQSTPIFTVMSFVDTTKYPPSLLYLLMTLGPSFIFLAFVESWRSKFLDAVTIYGRVPLFYYILHIYLIHLLTWIIFFLKGHTWSELDFIHRASGYAKGFGITLWGVYIMWVMVVLLLYVPCKWYNSYKSTHPHWWLKYI